MIIRRGMGDVQPLPAIPVWNGRPGSVGCGWHSEPEWRAGVTPTLERASDPAFVECRLSPRMVAMHAVAAPGVAVVDLAGKLRGQPIDLGLGGGAIVLGLGAGVWAAAWWAFRR